MRTRIKFLAILMSTLFLGAMLMESCSSTKPGFNQTGKARGSKVRSSGKMY